MSRIKIKSLSELTFEEKDLSIFEIQDVATRLNTIQNYFFPRLDSLITHTLDLVTRIYNVDPYEQMTILRTPRHRKDAENNKIDRNFIRIGVGGKRNNSRNLKTRNKNGIPYKHLQGRLYYLINPNGEVSVYLWILGDINISQNRVVLSQWRELIKDYFNILNIIFYINHIAYPQAQDFLTLDQILEEPYIQDLDSLQFSSSPYFLPISFERGIFNLQLAFVALYPLLVTSIDLEEGNPLKLRQMLEQYLDWYGNRRGSLWWNKH